MLESEGEGVFEFGEDGSGEMVKRVRKFEGEDAFIGRGEEEYNVEKSERERGGRD